MKTTSTLTKSQSKTFGPVYWEEKGKKYQITANVRYDDKCNNGHNSFSITADIKSSFSGQVWSEESGGCCHAEVAEHFPLLAPLIKWHLTSSEGPMHYISNAVYHAGDKDCHGLRKGEFRQYGRTGEGKERDLEAARSCAVWPEATDEELSAPDLEQKLLARLPALMAEFKLAVESLGFTY